MQVHAEAHGREAGVQKRRQVDGGGLPGVRSGRGAHCTAKHPRGLGNSQNFDNIVHSRKQGKVVILPMVGPFSTLAWIRTATAVQDTVTTFGFLHLFVMFFFLGKVCFKHWLNSYCLLPFWLCTCHGPGPGPCPSPCAYACARAEARSAQQSARSHQAMYVFSNVPLARAQEGINSNGRIIDI